MLSGRIPLTPTLFALISACGAQVDTTNHASDDVPYGDAPLADFVDGDGATWTLHDPTRMVERDGSLLLAVTGKEQEGRYACGLETWELRPGDETWQPGRCLLQDKPAWVAEELPSNDGAYWAPGFLGADLMYYSVSSGFDEEEGSCLGLLRARGEGDGRYWEDLGRPLFCSFDNEATGAPYPSSIDPAAFVDDDGSAWLVYGGGHIYAVAIDASTGLPLDDAWWSEEDSSHIHLANGPATTPEGEPSDGDEWTEAPFLVKRDGFYYLLLNAYACCEGPDSTYEIRVGRATEVGGPYLDREGVRLLDGGGTLVLDGTDAEPGPGHPGVHRIRFDGEDADLLTYHYYPPSGEPWATLGARLLYWEDGWPAVDPEPFDIAAWYAEAER